MKGKNLGRKKGKEKRQKERREKEGKKEDESGCNFEQRRKNVFTQIGKIVERKRRVEGRTEQEK